MTEPEVTTETAAEQKATSVRLDWIQPRMGKLLMIRYSFFLFVVLSMLPARSGAQAPLEGDLLPHLQSKPAFEFRGVVEGFYGRPWTHEERKDMIRFMGAVRMNAYFYAPKDDPFHRQRWREPYQGEDLARFRGLVQVAEESNVDLYYAIHPGLSIVYSDEADYQALVSKLDAMRDLGVEHFALFVDDVPLTLQHEEDKQRFSNLAEAHVYIINRLYNDLQERGNDLVVCPTTYTNAFGESEYVRILGEGIPEDIPLFWTGVDLAPPEITREEAEHWGELMSREPLIWDNFPVNDYDTWRPFLGPLYGRAPDLNRAARGIISNPMSEVYASMLPLFTVAEYAWDPVGYDPDSSIRRAISTLYGDEAAPHVEVFSEIYRPAGWEDNVFTPLVTPGIPLHKPTLREAIDRLSSALNGIREAATGHERIGRLADDLAPYVSRTDSLLRNLSDDPAYRLTDDGFLEFREDWEVVMARPAPFEVTVDGDLSLWTHRAFYRLKPMGTSRIERPAEVAFLYDDEYLYAAIHVTDRDLQPRRPVYAGDHITLAVTADPDAPERYLQPDDLLVLMPPPDEDGAFQPILRILQLSGFTARGIADIHLPALSSFFYQFSRPAEETLADLTAQIRYAARRTEDGYDIEIAVPRNGTDTIRLNVTQVNIDVVNGAARRQTATLSVRPYLGNPQAYPIVRLVEP